MRRKSPQEKKRLSYAKDRRERHGENDKSSRKNIPRHKRRVNRAKRHREQQVLNGARGSVDVESAATAEESLLKTRPERWQKSAGATLGTLVQHKLAMKSERTEFEAGTLSPLDDDELRGLLTSAVHLLSARKAALIHLMCHTGLRMSEVSALELRDVSAEAVTVRGRRRRTVPLPVELRPLLDSYLRVRAERPGAAENPAFFVTVFGCRVPPASVNGLVTTFAIMIGLPGVSARTLRKTYAVNLLRAGVDLDEAAELLGHASPEATRAYLARRPIGRMYLPLYG
ncbi:tyrosine-type recombinase/integrase [Amycolatopsis thailandensis]|uniref:tyrosine-type recombinase/integrase n=1 Tax=Amycolatopsis thailandensis TaxID=589330 RepID=UPI0037A83DC8